MINESSDSANSGQFETVAFPVIRRVFAKLLANDIVSVQALNLPIGKLYYINPKASVRKYEPAEQYSYPGHVAPNNVWANYSPDGAYANAAQQTPASKVQFEDRSLYDAFYSTEYAEEGAQLFDRSKGQVLEVTGVTLVEIVP